MLWRKMLGLFVVALSAIAVVLIASLAAATADRPHQRVSQKDQAFSPNEVSIARGTTLDIVNDDGETLHHAYVESPTFSFDSGDQEPGTTAAIPSIATEHSTSYAAFIRA